jgi:prefoldin subunit 5
MKKGYAFAGANAYLAQKIRSVKEVIVNIKEEFAIARQQFAVKINCIENRKNDDI